MNCFQGELTILEQQEGRGYQFLQVIIFPSLVNRGFLLQWHTAEQDPWSSQSFPSDRKADVSSSNCRHETPNIVTIYLWLLECLDFPIVSHNHCRGVCTNITVSLFIWVQILHAQHVPLNLVKQPANSIYSGKCALGASKTTWIIRRLKSSLVQILGFV